METSLTIEVSETESVSALLRSPPGAAAAYVLAHGAGAGMRHPFMAAVATGLGERGVATLRYQFPYMERGSKRPDRPDVAHAAVRAAVGTCRTLLPNVALYAGGKSFGGRMTSQAQAKTPLEGVRGLAFLGFPLHPAGKPSRERAAHLSEIDIPMLFLQGTRDALAGRDDIEAVCASLGKRATLTFIDGADHGLHVPAKSGRRDADVMEELCDALAAWMQC